MINRGNNVPDKTIVIFPVLSFEEYPKELIDKTIVKPKKTREWFTPHFYRCLPLSVANQYGYLLTAPFGFSVVWDGTDSQDGIQIEFDSPETSVYPKIQSHFGSGIFTINYPFVLMTPPGINLMTVNPPNYVVPNVTVMSGVVEADNLRNNFTFNFRVQIPNLKVHFGAGTPMAAILPIPRYFSDGFKLKYDLEIFDQKTIEEERQARQDSNVLKEKNEQENKGADRLYLTGQDVYGNKFTDHQIV